MKWLNEHRRMTVSAIGIWLAMGHLSSRAKSEEAVFVSRGRPLAVMGSATSDMHTANDVLVIPGGREGDFADAPIWKIRGYSTLGWGNTLEGQLAITQADFRIYARLTLPEVGGTDASFIMGGGYHTPFAVPEGRHSLRIWLDGAEEKMYVADYSARLKENGSWPTRPYNTRVLVEKYPRIRTAGRRPVASVGHYITAGKPFDFELQHKDRVWILRIDGKEIFRSALKVKRWPVNFGFLGDRGPLHIHEFRAQGEFAHPEVEHTDVWNLGCDGYNSYRIPAICSTEKGAILAFVEARRPGPNKGNVDCVVKRSTDGGRTWSAQEVLWDPGDESFARNPSPVLDRETGDVFLLLGSNMPSPGTDEPGRHRLFLTRTGDEGKSWSRPRALNIATDGMEFLTGGPCHGIQLRHGPHRGRLVVPCYASIGGATHSCVVYSDDHGDKWALGGIASSRTNECTVVELENGEILLNCRDSGENYLSGDGGETFRLGDWQLSGRTVQATLLRHSWANEDETGNQSRVFFSFPSAHSRRAMVVKMSYDHCKTWPISRLVYPGGAAYSVMTPLPDGRVGLLYEKDDYRRVSFVALKLDWLTGSKAIP